MRFVEKVEPVSLRLREIVGANGEGVITDWLSTESDARARFHVRIGNMRKVPKTDWTKKQFRKLKKADGIAEIKWEAGNKQWRALGFEKDGYFLMLIGCTHKGDVYVPASCIQTAMRLKKEVEKGQHKIIDYQE
jgi:hypothetical protein